MSQRGCRNGLIQIYSLIGVLINPLKKNPRPRHIAWVASNKPVRGLIRSLTRIHGANCTCNRRRSFFLDGLRSRRNHRRLHKPRPVDIAVRYSCARYSGSQVAAGVRLSRIVSALSRICNIRDTTVIIFFLTLGRVIARKYFYPVNPVTLVSVIRFQIKTRNCDS